MIYIFLDGVFNNRFFINMYFLLLLFDMVGFNLFCDVYLVVFIVDLLYLFKRIRNNILSSGICKWYIRFLKIDGCVIIWKIFIDVYDWDKKYGFFIY